jgi:hypothetical protein
MVNSLKPRSAGPPSWIILLVCAVITVAAGVLRSPDVDEDLEGDLPEKTTGQGFATSATCQSCHPAQYDAWHRSYHRTMTQVATPSTVLATFDDVVLEDRGFRYQFVVRDDEIWVEMPDPLWFEQPLWLMEILDPSWPGTPPRIEGRVVMATGSHHMQNYWIRRPDEGEGALDSDDGALIQVPWIWMIQEERWVPNQDSFISPPSDSPQGPLRWNATCSQCHSVGTEPRTSESFDSFDTRTVELGIACEACHGPGEQHVRFYQSPVRRYLRHFRKLRGEDPPDPTIANPAKLEPRRSVETCAQCHSFGKWRDQEGFRRNGVPFRPGDELDEHMSVFLYTEDPQDPLLLEELETEPTALESRFWRDGTIRVTGREYNGLLESPGHTDDMTCLSCHSMHDYEAPDSQLDPDFTGNRSCLGCHTDYAEEISEHTRHLPESSGSECMNCHMPHTTYGLFSAIRSHRIDSPSAQVSLETGRPNACNLCHLDKTMEWTNQSLNEWYGQPLVEMGEDERSIAASILWAMKGDVAQRTILAWHMGWDAAREVSGQTWMAPYLAQLLMDSYSATRQVAYRSIGAFPGFQNFEFDFIASGPEREEKAREAFQRWIQAGGPGRAGAHLLIDENAAIDFAEWARLLAEQDQRPLKIIE